MKDSLRPDTAIQQAWFTAVLRGATVDRLWRAPDTRPPINQHSSFVFLVTPIAAQEHCLAMLHRQPQLQLQQQVQRPPQALA